MGHIHACTYVYMMIRGERAAKEREARGQEVTSNKPREQRRRENPSTRTRKPNPSVSGEGGGRGETHGLVRFRGEASGKF